MISKKIRQEVREDIAFENAEIAREVRAVHRNNCTHHFADLSREAYYGDIEQREENAAWLASR